MNGVVQKLRLGQFVVVGVLFLLGGRVCRAMEQASWYGEDHRGFPMANGERFNPDKFTAASWFFPLGTRVVVTHAGRSVVVEITDRGPAKHLVRDGRKIDLSRAAFARLANLDRGLISVSIKKPKP
jgi:rare lipoprotein A